MSTSKRRGLGNEEITKWTRHSSGDKIVIKIMPFISFQTRQLTDHFSTSVMVSYWGDVDEIWVGQNASDSIL